MGMEDFPRPQEAGLEPEPGSGEAGEFSPEQIKAYEEIAGHEEQFSIDMRTAENEPGVVKEYLQLWREEHARRKKDDRGGIISGTAKLGSGVGGVAGFFAGGVPGAGLGAMVGGAGGAAFGLGLTAAREALFFSVIASEHAVKYGKRKVESAKALLKKWKGGGDQEPVSVA